MPYGTVSSETKSLISESALLHCEIEDALWRVDVVVGGALDESFSVSSYSIAEEIAEAIAESLYEHKDLDPGETFEVTVYEEGEPPAPLHVLEGARN